MTTYLLEKNEDFDASDFQRYFSEIFEERGFEVHFPGVEFQEGQQIGIRLVRDGYQAELVAQFEEAYVELAVKYADEQLDEFQELLEAALKALVALEIIKDVKITA